MNLSFVNEKAMQAWWKTLSTDRKRIVLAFAIILAFILYYLLIWSPLSYRVADLKDKINKDQNLLVLVKQANVKIRSNPQNKLNKTLPLLTVVDEQSKIIAWKSAPLTMKQVDLNNVEVTFSRINFDDFITGLEQLTNNFNLSVEKVNLMRLDMGEAVQVSLLLTDKAKAPAKKVK